MAKAKAIKLPKIRRKYYQIYGLNFGLDYSKPSTMIKNEATPSCHEVLFRNEKIIKARGTTYFADTDTAPVDGTVMHFHNYIKTTGSEKLIVHTTTHVYYYDATNDVFVPISSTATNLVARVTVTHVPASANLVCSVTVTS